ncbi:MAG TPA: secretion protein [Planctomycetaceae bacterium]|nr:secretion protein [Planctomycetaceae bacterium]
MPPVVVFLAIGIGVASFLAFAVMSWGSSDSATNAEDRLEMLANRKQKQKTTSSLLLSSEFAGWENHLNQLAKKIPNINRYLEQSGLNVSAGRLIAMTIGAFVGGNLITMILPIPKFLAPILGILFATLPYGWVHYKRAKRLSLFGRQLPDALDLLGRSLRSGHSLPNGFALVGSEMKEPLAGEFYRVFEEQNLGIPMEEALDQLATRIPNLDLQFFATAVILQRTTGGDLAEILEKISSLIRARLKLLGTIAALTGEGRISGSVLLSMPPALFLYMLYVNPVYIKPLFTDELGKYMIFGAVIMQLLGAVAIKKIITIRV